MTNTSSGQSSTRRTRTRTTQIAASPAAQTSEPAGNEPAVSETVSPKPSRPQAPPSTADAVSIILHEVTLMSAFGWEPALIGRYLGLGLRVVEALRKQIQAESGEPSFKRTIVKALHEGRVKIPNGAHSIPEVLAASMSIREGANRVRNRPLPQTAYDFLLNLICNNGTPQTEDRIDNDLWHRIIERTGQRRIWAIMTVLALADQLTIDDIKRKTRELAARPQRSTQPKEPSPATAKVVVPQTASKLFEEPKPDEQPSIAHAADTTDIAEEDATAKPAVSDTVIGAIELLSQIGDPTALAAGEHLLPPELARLMEDPFRWLELVFALRDGLIPTPAPNSDVELWFRSQKKLRFETKQLFAQILLQGWGVIPDKPDHTTRAAKENLLADNYPQTIFLALWGDLMDFPEDEKTTQETAQ